MAGFVGRRACFSLLQSGCDHCGGKTALSRSVSNHAASITTTHAPTAIGRPRLQSHRSRAATRSARVPSPPFAECRRCMSNVTTPDASTGRATDQIRIHRAGTRRLR